MFLAFLQNMFVKASVLFALRVPTPGETGAALRTGQGKTENPEQVMPGVSW
jgi:hypothetical protein